MIREICKTEVFLAQKAEAATADDPNTCLLYTSDAADD